MRATPSPRVTAYAALAAVFLLAALGLRRPELAVLALPFALPLALGLRLARVPEIRVQVDVERAAALENDELDVELTVSSDVPNVMVGVDTSRVSSEMSWSSPRICESPRAASARALSSDGQHGASNCICRQ